MTFAMQLLSGENLIGQGVQFLQQAGIATKLSFDLNMVLNSMFIIGTIFSWGCKSAYLSLTLCLICSLPVLTRFGRRTIYTGGMAVMCIFLFIIGGLGFKKNYDNQDKLTIGGLLIALNFIYNCSLGPICYTIIGEIPSTRLRQKSIVLSRIAYQIMNIVCGIIVPRMLSPTAWNWGPKSGIFWGASAGLSTLYCWLRLPESRFRSYGELDMLFEMKVPAWRFSSTKVDRTSPFFP
jgi:MFS transporter, SP family, general alpha glucoside:H+ symporter